MLYSDIAGNKKAFIFELDNVLYPEKDYLLQVYYLFAGFLDYTELLDEKMLLKLMTDTYYKSGPDRVFDELQSKFKIDDKYRANLAHLMMNAKLPLPLLLFEPMLTMLQEMVVDRKQIFIVTAGSPELQLNKIKQIEWSGLGQYLTCYFAEEFAGGEHHDVIEMLSKQHSLHADELLMIGNAGEIEQLVAKHNVDIIKAESFLTQY